MGGVVVIILHSPVAHQPGPLSQLLDEARRHLADVQAARFRRAGATDVRVERAVAATSFGEHLAERAADLPAGSGLVILGAGSVPRLTLADARRLVAAAAAADRRVLTNNRYSSDVCAVSRAAVLTGLPALPGDNALPRWLAERAGYAVAELPGRGRLALDLDSPLDLALLRLLPRPPAGLAGLAARHGLGVPRLEELHALLADRRRELLVAGRASSSGLAILERRAACRVRFLSEERGLRASSPLAQAPSVVTGRRPRPTRPPRSTLGRLLEERGGPTQLASLVAELADGAILDSRVLLADRLGANESAWPSLEDRAASDLLQPDHVVDTWLRELTASAASSPAPILLGGHTLLGPGLELLTSA
jgi:CTP:molybdopterin cytidylyltransferase MocA